MLMLRWLNVFVLYSGMQIYISVFVSIMPKKRPIHTCQICQGQAKEGPGDRHISPRYPWGYVADWSGMVSGGGCLDARVIFCYRLMGLI